MGFLDKIGQANSMMKKFKEVQKKMETTFVTGEAGGLVKISMNGVHSVKSIEIDDSLLSIDRKKKLNELLCLAFNDGVKKTESVMKENSSLLQDILPQS